MYLSPNSKPAFMPIFNKSEQAHVTLNDVVADKRFRNLPIDDSYLGTKEYARTMQIGTNVI